MSFRAVAMVLEAPGIRMPQQINMAGRSGATGNPAHEPPPLL